MGSTSSYAAYTLDRSNPFVWRDPTGRFSLEETMAAVTIVGITASEAIAMPGRKGSGGAPAANLSKDDPLNYANVRDDLAVAWYKSNPCTAWVNTGPFGKATNRSQCDSTVEQAGWIVEHTGAALYIFDRFDVHSSRTTGATMDSTELNPDDEPIFGTVVRTWHTHPVRVLVNGADVTDYHASATDKATARRADVPEYIITWTDLLRLDPKTAHESVIGSSHDILELLPE